MKNKLIETLPTNKLEINLCILQFEAILDKILIRS